MKFFKFLSREKEISISQARKLFEENKSKHEESKKELLGDLERQYGETREYIQEALRKLEGAKLMNDKIPAREKSIMDGNRKGYISQVIYFLKVLPIDLLEAESVFNERLEVFSKSSFKGYQILIHFFETEVHEIVSGIKRLEEIFKSSRKGLDENLVKLSSLFKELDSVKNAKKKINEEKEKRKRDHFAKENEVNKLTKEIGDIKNSNEYGKFNSSKEHLERLLREEREISKEIYQLILQFSKLLRKYHNLMGDEVSLKMEETPVEAFYNEPEKVLRVLSELADLVSRNQIIVKPNEKQKLIKRLSSINEDHLLDSHIKLKSKREKIRELNSKIKDNKILDKLDELEHGKEWQEKQLRELKEKLDEKIPPPRKTDSIIIEIQESLSKLLGNRFTIS